MTVEERTIQTGMIATAVSFGFWGCVDTGTGSGEGSSFSEVKGAMTSWSLSSCIMRSGSEMTNDTLDDARKTTTEEKGTKEQLSKPELLRFLSTPA